MLMFYSTREGNFECCSDALPDTVKRALWIDLKNPTAEEEYMVESVLGLSVPNREEMREIEVSSRLYFEAGYHYMTIALLCYADSDEPVLGNVTFILNEKHLITVRYDEPKSFVLFQGRVCGADKFRPPDCADAVFRGLLETIIDRAADVMELHADDIDRISTGIFRKRKQPRSKNNYQVALRRIGHQADVLSKIRESLATLSRMLLYLASDSEGLKLKADIKSMVKDVQSLNDYAAFLVNKITFLLDALLGMVSIEQNDIIKLFSVIAVVLLPPTLCASIYGMNFTNMPELEWTWGYPYALGLMLVSAILPYLFFKWRRWF